MQLSVGMERVEWGVEGSIRTFLDPRIESDKASSTNEKEKKMSSAMCLCVYDLRPYNEETGVERRNR